MIKERFIRKSIGTLQEEILSNECHFTHARCLSAQKGIALRIVPNEECPTLSGAPLLPTLDDLEPVSEKSSVAPSTGLEPTVPSIPSQPPTILIDCSNEWAPVCGSDFATYPNKCIMDQAALQNPTLEILFKGTHFYFKMLSFVDECDICLKSPCPDVNPDSDADDSLFVCDESGETRSNCEFKMLQCIYELNYGKNLTEAHVSLTEFLSSFSYRKGDVVLWKTCAC